MKQKIWKNCMAEIFYTKGSYLVENNYEVRLQGNVLEVYTLGGPKNLVGFKGIKTSRTGHYQLQGIFGGSSTLHRSPDTNVFEGSWEEHGQDGMWRIHLSAPLPSSQKGA